MRLAARLAVSLPSTKRTPMRVVVVRTVSHRMVAPKATNVRANCFGTKARSRRSRSAPVSDRLTTTQPIETTAHELGHALGLYHAYQKVDDNRRNLMWTPQLFPTQPGIPPSVTPPGPGVAHWLFHSIREQDNPASTTSPVTVDQFSVSQTTLNLLGR